MAFEKTGASEAAHWAALIQAIAVSQSRPAFAELFAYFAPRVKTFMRRSGTTDSAADELAQETMLMVWRKAATFDPASCYAAAWIFRIARNLRIDALRRERGRVGGQSDIESEFLIDDAPLPDARIDSARIETRVKAALSNLSTEQMRVIELSFYEDRAHAEIAQILDIPLGTVKSRLRLAMNRLRKLLEELS